MKYFKIIFVFLFLVAISGWAGAEQTTSHERDCSEVVDGIFVQKICKTTFTIQKTEEVVVVGEFPMTDLPPELKSTFLAEYLYATDKEQFWRLIFFTVALVTIISGLTNKNGFSILTKPATLGIIFGVSGGILLGLLSSVYGAYALTGVILGIVIWGILFITISTINPSGIIIAIILGIFSGLLVHDYGLTAPITLILCGAMICLEYGIVIYKRHREKQNTNLSKV